ncbi:actin family [Blastocladiella britannica]|nr:actin family [Blastocladiella britannica]
MATIVLDFGSFLTRAGFAHDLAPSLLVPTVVGHPRYAMANSPNPGPFCGHEALRMIGVLRLRYPVQHGLADSLADLTTFWAFLSAQVLGPETIHPVMIVEPARSSQNLREQLAHIAFTTINVPALQFVPAAVAVLLASNLASGLVVMGGNAETAIVPVVHGRVRTEAIVWSTELGGECVFKRMVFQLMDRDTTVVTASWRRVVGPLLDQYAYVAPPASDPLHPLNDGASSPAAVEYESGHGDQVRIVHDQWQCTEVLFSADAEPSLRTGPLPNVACDGIQGMVYACLSQLDASDRALLRCVALSGTLTSYRGFAARLQAELDALIPSPGERVKVVVPPRGSDSKHAAWIGAAEYARVSSPESSHLWISKREYEDRGSLCV